MTVAAIFLSIAAEYAWIKLPEDKNVTHLIALVGRREFDRSLSRAPT